jgi:CRP/FNR family transcriptional regulator
MFATQELSLTTVAAPPVPASAAPSSSLADLCTLLGITADIHHYRHMRFSHVRLHKAQSLYRLGEPFQRLYAIKTGVLKAKTQEAHDSEQVVGFPMKGSLVGVDGIATGRYMVELEALGDSEMVVIPMETLTMLGPHCPGLQRGICYAMAAELEQELSVNKRRGLCTKARLGHFLLDLSERFGNLGYARNAFNLPMSRGEIANYLGMAHETVSRALVALEEDGVISLSQRTIRIHDRQALLSLKRLPHPRPTPN